MAARADLPPALATLVEVGVALARQAPSARIAIVRAGEAIDPETIRPEARERFEREVEAARAEVLDELPFADVERVLRETWKQPPGKVLDELDPDPIAVRPVSQVHRGALDGEPVAVKVRRPGVESAVRTDLSLLDVIATPMRAAFPNLDAVAVLRDVREQALDELDFEHEASQQRRVARSVRRIGGVTVPRPHLDLCSGEVLVSDLLAGATLGSGARPPDAGVAARALVDAFRAAVLDAGLAPVDPRPSHVVVAPDGTLGLLGMGIARPVDRERAARALDALHALTDVSGEARFVSVVVEAGVLGEEDAAGAHETVRDVLQPMLGGPAPLDAAALRTLGERAEAVAPALARLAIASSPLPEDVSLGRMLGQLVGVLARLGATEDWPAIAGG